MVIRVFRGGLAEARTILENDDAVKEKIMTAQLFPFPIALSRQPWIDLAANRKHYSQVHL